MLASFDNVKVEYAKVSAREGVFAVVNLDYDQAWKQDDGSVIRYKSRPSRNKAGVNILGLPATARFIVNGTQEYVSLHEDLQKWMHSLCKARVPSMSDAQAKNEWKGLMWGGRMITDFAGSDTHADYVNNVNLDQEPMKLKPMVTGGTVLKIKGERRVKGVDCYVVEAVNPTGNYRQYDPVTNWWLFFYPTISRREQVIRNDYALIENLSIPFPQYSEQTILPVFATEGNDYNFVPVDRVRILGATEKIPSPYVMPFGQYKPNPYERFNG